MAVRLTKDWISADEILAQLKGNLGVFQLADARDEIVFIGFAGGKSRFGLKGEVDSALQKYPDVTSARFEVTTAYHTRYRELLMAYVADHDTLPRYNEQINIGRLSPS